jgi:excisionase family DNA binding protein
MTDTAESQRADLLYGAPAIADYLGLTNDAVYHLARQKRIPTFRMGRTVCARKSTLARAIAELEAESSAA